MLGLYENPRHIFSGVTRAIFRRFVDNLIWLFVWSQIACVTNGDFMTNSQRLDGDLSAIFRNMAAAFFSWRLSASRTRMDGYKLVKRITARSRSCYSIFQLNFSIWNRQIWLWMVWHLNWHDINHYPWFISQTKSKLFNFLHRDENGDGQTM